MVSHSEKSSFDGGYEGEDTSREVNPDFKRWNLRDIDPGLHGGVLAHLECDGEARGFIQLKDEKEFKWLKDRVDGDQPL